MTDHRVDMASTEDWLRHHYAHGADALDVDGFMRGMTADIELTSNGGTVIGTDAVRQSAEQLFSILTSMAHDIHRVEVPADDIAVVDATVSYHFVNGAEISLPCTTTFRFRENEVRAVHIDIDSAAVIAAATGADR
jgi:SnoaL-like protein